MRSRIVAPIVLLLFMQMSCGKNANVNPPSVPVARSLQLIAITLGNLTDSVETAYQSKLISKEDRDSYLQVALAINVAGQEANKILKNLVEVDQVDALALIKILKPMRQALTDAALKLAGVADETTKQQLQLLIETMETSLTSVMLVLAAGGA